jgi:hypothetical protein
MVLILLLVLIGFVAGSSIQTAAPPPRPLAMSEAHACSIEYGNVVALQGRWGGQIAIYDATTDSQGAVVSLRRRIIEGREHLPPLVKLDQFEDCIRRWRFEGQADFEVSLLGGTTFGGQWIIQVSRDGRQFRLRMPVAKIAG